MVIAKVGVAATIPSLSYPKIGPKIYRQNQLTLVAHLKKNVVLSMAFTLFRCIQSRAN